MAMTNFGTNDPLAVNLWSSAPQAAIRAALIAEDSCSALGMTGRDLMTARGYRGVARREGILVAHNMGQLWDPTRFT